MTGSPDRPYPAAAGSAAGAVSAARARRARSGRNARIAAIAIAAVAAVAVAAFAVAPRLGINLGSGEVEVTDLAQMSPEEAGGFLSGLREIKDNGSYYYTMSDELAEAMATDGDDSDKQGEALKESGGSVYFARDESGNRINAEAVSNWDNAGTFAKMRVVDEMPDTEEVVDTVRGLGGEHMVVWKDDSSLLAGYTVGDDIFGVLSYLYLDEVGGIVVRGDTAQCDQEYVVSRLLAAVQTADLQGEEGLRDYLVLSDNYDILYYE